MISIVTPAFNEAKSLPALYERLCAQMDRLDVSWEWTIVDDHSSDRTFEVVNEISGKDPRVRGLRLSRNFGSHNAYLCGFEFARGDAVVTISADGQDAPETISRMIETWRQGAQVVWATRSRFAGDAPGSRLVSRTYNVLMRRIIGIDNIPVYGADFVLLDRKVVVTLKKYGERNMSLFALISWIGFRQANVEYERQPREHGASGWTFAKKLKLLVDSIAAFSYLPIRLMALVGAAVALIGLAYVPVIVAARFLGEFVQGWTELMVVVLVIGGLQMLMLAVLGEYLWRTLEEARGRPRYLIEAATPPSEPVGESDNDQAAV